MLLADFEHAVDGLAVFGFGLGGISERRGETAEGIRAARILATMGGECARLRMFEKSDRH